MTLAVLRLSVSRLRRRLGPASLVILAVAATIAVIGALSGLSVMTRDGATQHALAALPVRERMIIVSRWSSADDPPHAVIDAAAADALRAVAAYSSPTVTASLIRDPFQATGIIAVDGVGRWLRLEDGRLPAPCTTISCEGVALARPWPEDPDPNSAELGQQHIQSVGFGTVIDDLPIDPPLDIGEYFVAEGRDSTLSSPALAKVARVDFWAAPVDPARLRAWDLGSFQGAAGSLERALADAEASLGISGFVVVAPQETVAKVQAQAGAADGRLVAIGSLAAAILLAFAAFAAAIGRSNVEAEYRRLVRQGAQGRHLLTFILAEATLPAILGVLLGAVVGAGSIAFIAGNQAPLVPVLSAALFDQDRSLLVLAAVVIAVAAVAVGIHPALRGAIKPRTLLLTLGPVLAVLAWDAVTRGPLSGEALASQASGPLLTIAPALLAFSVILVCVTLVPMLFRWLARLSARFPVSMRLSLHSLARDSDQPAAALTLLTVSLAAICFGLGYSATLRQGATDQAAYATGMDLRVTELGASSSRLQSVAPISRYTEAAPDAESFPVVRADMAVASGLDVDLVGLPPDALPLLRGWRADFSDRSPADLAAAIETPGEWKLAGHPITADGSVTVTYESTGDPVRLAGVVAHPGGEFTYLTFGDLNPGRNTAIGYTEDERSYLGAKLIALVLTNGGPSAAVGGPSAGLPQHALVTFEGLEDITGPRMVDLEVSGATGARYLRPAQPSDGLVLPAIVSPDLAALASADGRITLQNPQGDPYPVRVAAIANNFPTLQRLGRAFAIVDIDPVLVAINATLPGTGFPTEMWVRAPSDGRAAELASVFAQSPFRYPEVQLRTDLEAVRVADPFSEGVVRALLLAALAGLALAIIGVVMAAFVHLRDETGELGELEAQGVAPTTLARVVLVRTAILGVGGVLLGVALGVGLNHVATSFLALSADAVRAIPPLVVIESWAIVAVTGAAVLAVVTGLVATIATRRFRGDVRASA